MKSEHGGAFRNGESATVSRVALRVGAIAGAFIAVCGAWTIIQTRFITTPIERRAQQIETKLEEQRRVIEANDRARQSADSVIMVRVNNISEGQEHLPTRADMRYIIQTVRDVQQEAEWKAQRRALEQRRYADSLARRRR